MRIGLVLSGGMAKGAFQVGALKAIKEYIKPEDLAAISCSSVGCLNGFAFVSDRLDQAEKMWKHICENGNRRYINSILRSSFLQESINYICGESEQISNAFLISLLNLKERTVIYQNLAKVSSARYADYLKASVAMPLYNRPVMINGKGLYDGAPIDNIPVYPLVRRKLDYIICIYFDDCCYTFETPAFDRKLVKITFPTKKTIVDSLTFKEEAIDAMIQRGYRVANNILKPIFADGGMTLPEIYDYISFLNDHMGEKKMRITGDMLMTNFNKITSKLARHSIVY